MVQLNNLRIYISALVHVWDKKAVKKEWIENLVIDETINLLMNDALLEELADKLVALQSQEYTQLPLLKKQLADTARGIENVLNANRVY